MTIVAALQREVVRRGRLALGEVAWRSGLSRAARRTWLLGGFVGAAFGDNAAALFRHVRQHRPDIAATWVIDRRAVDADAAGMVGPVLSHDGIDAAAAAFAADVLVVSHGLHDLPGFASSRVKGLRVRLGHGLTALKKTKPPPGRRQADVARLFQLVPVASPFERENKRQWGIDDDALVICGVCRFDDLLTRARVRPPERRVVYMPTWRDWLHGAAIESDAGAQALLKLLLHPDLNAGLRARDVHLDVYFHRLYDRAWRERLRRAGGSHLHLVDVDSDVQGLLARSQALLTDYSSVVWDMLYLDRPVIFFAPDVDAYEKHRGAYFDLRSDLPGPVARTADDAVELLFSTIDGGFPLSADARTWQSRAFAFRDDQNCARVVRAIEAALGRR